MFHDTHSHLHDAKFATDSTEVISRFRAAGVSRVLTLGTTVESCARAIALAEANPDVVAAAGIHPGHVDEWNDDTTPPALEAFLAHPRVAVLGEIGLDRYWDKKPETLALQERAFRVQLALARKHRKAVSIHSREATAEVLAILREERAADFGGVLHCFAGTYEQAREGADLGFYIGVGGSSTYPNAEALRITLKRVGIDRIVLETDAPYLPPQPYRGKRNEPAFLPATATTVARMFTLSLEEVAARTRANAVAAFRWEA